MSVLSRIEVVDGDITKLDVEAIVNAANSSLRGGGGVDGAIHRAAGRELLAECIKIGSCPTGEARITRGYALKAKHVIHTVGPIWNGGAQDEPQLLASCYNNSLQLALDHDVRSVAFPCISTGIYRFPKKTACEIALASVTRWLEANALPERVVFCCFEEEDLGLYERRLNQLRQSS
jgi:O-acetyl-ADP-ribose deacetylase (regulator of RNase III)